MSKEYGPSISTALGGFFCVAAGAIASAGAAGLDYMKVNGDALPFVAGCALFGVALLTIGVCLISWGIQSRIKQQHSQMTEMNARIAGLESEFRRDHEVSSLIRLHEDAENRRQIEDKIKDILRHVEESQQQHSRKIEIHDAEIRRLADGRNGGVASAVARRLGGEGS